MGCKGATGSVSSAPMPMLFVLTLAAVQPVDGFSVPAAVECPVIALQSSPPRRVALKADDVLGANGPIIQLQIAVSVAEVEAFGRLNFLRIGGKVFAGGLMSRRLDDVGQTHFILSFERDMLGALAGGFALELVEKDGPGMVLGLAVADAAPLTECLAVNAPIGDGAGPLQLLRRPTFVATWPSQPLQIRSRSHVDTGYPTRALQEEREGETRIGFVIGTDGRVANCEVTASSGHADLDAASCRAARSLTYFPATNAAGEPIETKGEQRIRWEIPK